MHALSTSTPSTHTHFCRYTLVLTPPLYSLRLYSTVFTDVTRCILAGLLFLCCVVSVMLLKAKVGCFFHFFLYFAADRWQWICSLWPFSAVRCILTTVCAAGYTLKGVHPYFTAETQLSLLYLCSIALQPENSEMCHLFWTAVKSRVQTAVVSAVGKKTQGF